MAGVSSASLMAVRSGLKNGKNGQGPSDSRHGIKEKMKMRKHIECARDLVEQYDANGTGKLGRNEVRALLSDLTETGGAFVTEDELNFVFKIADCNRDETISAGEMSTLLNCWDNYQKCRPEIEKHFLKHDPDGTNRLDKEQLRGLLVELSGHRERPVGDEDVEWVLRQANILKNGVISKPELRRALALWESRMHRDTSCCTLQ